MRKTQKGRFKLRFWTWACLPAALCVGALWCKFGFSLGGMIEEWDFIWLLNRYPGLWNSLPGNPMADQFVARPLQITPFAIAYAIDRHSFIGFHVLLMAACFLRIVAGASIGYFSLRSRGYALAAGLLFFMLPADTQQMSFRTLSISVASGLMTLGVALSLRAIVSSKRGIRTANLTLYSILSCMSVLIYEPMLTLYVLAPLILFARYGWRKFWIVMRRRKSVALLWFVAPLLNAAYLAYTIFVLKSGYQATFSNRGLLRSIIDNLPLLWKSWAYRVFDDSWVGVVDVIVNRTAHYGFLVAAAILTAAVLFLVGMREKRTLSFASAARFVIIGLFAAIAAYLPFMVDLSHLVVTQRTFIGGAPGISLVVICLIAFVFQRARAAGLALSAVLVLLGFVAQLYQFDIYNRYYATAIRPYMSMMADMTDPSKRVHLVMDTSGVGGYLNGMYVSKVRGGAADRLHNTTDIYALCLDRPRSPIALHTECRLEHGKWIVDAFDGVASYPEDQVQIMRIGKNFDPNYWSRRAGWNDHASFLPERSIFKPTGSNRASYSCEADSDWGYSGFCRGDGWSTGMLRMTDYVNYFVAISPNPTFLFDLHPTSQRYRVEINTFGINPVLAPHMGLSVNGKPQAISITGTLIAADVSAADLVGGLNEIELSNMRLPDDAVGVPIRRIDVNPLN